MPFARVNALIEISYRLLGQRTAHIDILGMLALIAIIIMFNIIKQLITGLALEHYQVP